MENQDISEGKNIAVISYLTIFGTIIGFFLNNDKKNEFAAFHIRQALGLWLTFFVLGYVNWKQKVKQFENEWSEWLGAKHSLYVCSEPVIFNKYCNTL